MKFQCSSCGACCRQVGKLGLMPDRGDGACIHLQVDNKCAIYETRPDVCNVDYFLDKVNMSKIDYYKFTNTICNSMIKEDKMDDSYLINIGNYDV